MKRRFLIALLAALVLCLSGCGLGLEVRGEIPDYDAVIGGMIGFPAGDEEKPDKPEKPTEPEKPAEPENPGTGKEPEEEKPEPPPETDVVPQIDGYKHITPTAVDKPSSFGNNFYTPVTLPGKSVLLGKDGSEIEAPSDLTKLVYDKYIFETDGLKGVKSADGELLIAAEYDKIDIVGNTVLALNDRVARVFDTSTRLGKAMLISEVSRGRFSSLSVYADGLIVADGELCGTNLRPKIYDGCRAVAESGGIAVIKDESERLGYYDTESRKLISAPKYRAASLFVGGYAVARETVGGDNIIVDKSGNEVARFSESVYGLYDGYMFADDGLGRLELYDEKFLSTGLKFDSVLGKRVYGNYIIDTLNGKIFSLAEGKYVSEAYSDIIPVAGGGFILKKDGTATLVDTALKIIISADEIIPDKDVICVRLENKYYYFVPEARK